MLVAQPVAPAQGDAAASPPSQEAAKADRAKRTEEASFARFVRQVGQGTLDEGAEIRAHQAWLWYRLTYPTGKLPPDPWGRAARHIERFVPDAEPWRLQGAPLRPLGPEELVIDPTLSTWVEFGPRPLDSTGTTNNAYQYGIVAGRLNVVVSDPVNHGAGAGDRAWLGFASGGLWMVEGIRSVDCSVTPCDVSGVTATPMWDGFIASTQGVSAITIDPSDASGNTLYVGTGDWQANDQFSAGILKTIDGGATWTQLGADVFTPYSNVLPPDQANGGCPGCTGNRWSNQNIKAIAVDPNDPQTILAGTRYDLYLSNDAGATWQICNFGSSHTNPEGTIGGITGINRISGIYLDARTATTRAYVAVGYATNANNQNNGVYGFDVPASGCPAWPGAFTNFFDGLPAGTGTTTSLTGRTELDGHVDGDGFLTLYAQVTNASTLEVQGTYVLRPDNPAWPTAAGNAAIKDWRLLTGGAAANYDSCTGAASGTGQDWYDLFIKAHPTTDQMVYIGHIDAFKAQITTYSALGLSGASNITNVYNQGCASYGKVHPDQHGFAFVEMPGDPDYGDWILLANDGGVFLNTNAGDATQWAPLAKPGIGTNQFYSGQIGMDFGDLDDNGIRGNPTDGRQWLFGGMQDNGNASWDSTRPDLQWTARGNGGDGFWTAFDALGGTLSAGYWLTEYTYGDLSCSSTGADGPFSSTNCVPNHGTDSPDWSAPLVMDQFHCTNTQCKNVLSAGDRVFASTAYGTPAWTALNSTVLPGTAAAGSVVSLAMAPSEPKAVVAGTDNGKWWWTENAFTGTGCIHANRDTAALVCAANASTTWRPIDATNTTLPNRVLGGVAFDPTNHNVVYAAVGGFSENTPTTPGHIFRAVWNGASFAVTDKSGNLPDVPAQSVAVNPHNPNQVFLGTLFGFYYTDDISVGSPFWVRYMDGLPNAPIFHLTIDRGPFGNATASTTLAAFTYGRGTYAIKLPGAGESFCSTLPAAPGGVAAGTPAANTIQVTWNDSTTAGATGYRVYRATAPGGPYTQVGGTVPDSSPGVGGSGSYLFDDTPVSGGSTYYYVVRTLQSSCSSSNSVEASASATGDCLLAPTFGGVQSATQLAGGEGCGLRVAWNVGASQCGGALTYSIFRSTTSGFAPSAANRIAACQPGTTYDDTNAAVDTPLYYVVRAEDGGAAGGGACNGGNSDANTVQAPGFVSSTGTQTLYSNGFESGSGLSDWSRGTFLTGGSVADWLGIQTCTAHAGTGIFRFGGSPCAGNYSSGVFSFAQPGGAAGFTVPAGLGTVRLSFWHRRAFNTGDGALLAVSLDGTNYTLVPAAAILTNSYTGTANGYPAWTGAQASFVNTVVDVDAACVAAGALGGCGSQSVRVAFAVYTNGTQTDDGWFLDDVIVTAGTGAACTSAPQPVQFLTATGKNQQVTVEWLEPGSGALLGTRLRTSTVAPPADPTAGTLLVDEPGNVNDKETYVHAAGGGSNGIAQHYSAFGNSGAAFSAQRTLAGLPQATTGNWKWNFSTPATALAPPIQGRGLGIFLPSNDRGFYALGVGSGAGGGLWKSGYQPAAMNAPAQSSPIVMLAADTGLPHDAAFVGSQDGHVYCFAAATGLGCTGWPAGGRSADGFTMVQAQPMFDPVTQRILFGTRDAVGANSFNAIDVLTGATAWSFTNNVLQGGDGQAMGIVSGPALILGSRVIFNSRARAGGSAHSVWALDFTAATVSFAWARDLGDIDAAPTLDFTASPNRVIVGTNAGAVVALDPTASGATLWSRAFANGPVKGFVYFHAAANRLYFTTDSTVWSIPASGATGSDWALSGLFSPTRPLLHFGTTRTYVGACNDAACANGRVIELDSADAWGSSKSLDLAGVGGLGPVTIDRSQTPALLHAGSRTGRAVAVEIPLP